MKFDKRAFAEKYSLTKGDFWEMRRGSKRLMVITHDACEKIAAVEQIKFDLPIWLATGENGVWAVQVSGSLNGHSKWTTGEVSPDNCKMSYPVAMAEKRAIDRLVLKLVSAYEYGVYSEVESEDFQRPLLEVSPTIGEVHNTRG